MMRPFHLVSSNPAMIAARAVGSTPGSGTARAPAVTRRLRIRRRLRGDVRFSLPAAGHVEHRSLQRGRTARGAGGCAMVSSRRPHRDLQRRQRGRQDTGERGVLRSAARRRSEPDPEADHRSGRPSSRRGEGPRSAAGPPSSPASSTRRPSMHRSASCVGRRRLAVLALLASLRGSRPAARASSPPSRRARWATTAPGSGSRGGTTTGTATRTSTSPTTARTPHPKRRRRELHRRHGAAARQRRQRRRGGLGRLRQRRGPRSLPRQLPDREQALPKRRAGGFTDVRAGRSATPGPDRARRGPTTTATATSISTSSTTGRRTSSFETTAAECSSNATTRPARATRAGALRARVGRLRQRRRPRPLHHERRPEPAPAERRRRRRSRASPGSRSRTAARARGPPGATTTTTATSTSTSRTTARANKLIRNDGGDAFTQITTGPLGDRGNSTGVAWGDYDNDGDLDLYVANYGQPSALLRNDGASVFTAITSGALGDDGNGTGVAWADYDGDGDLDLYVVNDGQANKLLAERSGGRESLARDRSRRGGSPTDRRSEPGSSSPRDGATQIQEVSGGSGYMSQNSLHRPFRPGDRPRWSIPSRSSGPPVSCGPIKRWRSIGSTRSMS